MRLTGRTVTLVTVAISLAALACTTTGAAAGTAGSVQLSRQHPRAGLFAVSCAGASFCLAVGGHTGRFGKRHALAEEWNGTAWRVLKDPPGKDLLSVSCTSASFCMASAVYKGSRPWTLSPETWNGKNWRAQKRPADATSAISCGGPRLCMVIRGGVEVESWNGRKWRTWTRATNICSGSAPGPCGLADVSCGNRGSCVAVGNFSINNNGDQQGFAFTWDGHGWNGGFAPSYTFSGLTCIRQGFCLAAGGKSAATWTLKLGWHDVSPDLTALCGANCSLPGVVGCGSPSSCIVLLSFSTALAWNGSSWRATHPVPVTGVTPYLADVSCGTPTSCIAVGEYARNFGSWTLAEQWNGRIWRVTRTFSPR